eukprot:274357-Chlamydomonas_euryale.AAC.2
MEAAAEAGKPDVVSCMTQANSDTGAMPRDVFLPMPFLCLATCTVRPCSWLLWLGATCLHRARAIIHVHGPACRSPRTGARGVDRPVCTPLGHRTSAPFRARACLAQQGGLPGSWQAWQQTDNRP